MFKVTYVMKRNVSKMAEGKMANVLLDFHTLKLASLIASIKLRQISMMRNIQRYPLSLKETLMVN